MKFRAIPLHHTGDMSHLFVWGIRALYAPGSLVT